MTTPDALNQLRQDFEEELSHYGQYLAMRGAKEGEQRFGIPEIALAALVIVVWASKEFLQAYLQEKAKKLAQASSGEDKKNKELEAQHKELLEEFRVTNRRLEELDAKWNALLKQLPPQMPARLPPGQANDEELLALLLGFGLSERAARKASTSILTLVESSS